MKKKILFFAAVLSLAAVFSAEGDARVKPLDYYGSIARRLAAALPRYHVLQQPFDDEISRQAWTNLVTYYDFDRSVFLRSDLDALAERDTALDDELKAGNVSFGYDVYALYCERLSERIGYATNLVVSGEWDFSADESYVSRRKDAMWPEDGESAREYWRKRIKNELLVQIVTGELDAEKNKKDFDRSAALETAKTNLVKRYTQYLAILTEPDEEAVLQHYLSSVSRAYDPHSDYMSPVEKEEFDMGMNLVLCGVGAVLQMEDGALKIVEIMPGGPVDRDGRIEEGDKIIGVKQGDGEMEDIMWQPMKKTIRKIRGKKGTRVTLELVPRTDPTGTSKKTVELVRDEIKLEDQAATGRVERVIFDGRELKIGYICLPGFYGTMDKRPGEKGYRSCADDVAAYLADFNARDVDALVLDLRGDGGGSLKEAARLSELFVPSGPVVQIRDTRAVMPLTLPTRRECAFMKPMAVMIDRASASASEIVAGHLRDTGRAVIIGDSCSHGKGTVQTVMGMGPEKYGSMKITTARFYRINGRSTQINGVASDIYLPSLLDHLDIGEDKLMYALPFSRIRRLEYARCWNIPDKAEELRAKSLARTSADPAFKEHLEKVERMKEISERKEVPLEIEARKAMMAADRAVSEDLDSEDGDFSGDGDDVAADGKEDGESKDAAKPGKSRRRRSRRMMMDGKDTVLDETFRIVADLVLLMNGEKMPPGRIDWLNGILGM